MIRCGQTRYALTLIAVALLAGCGGSQPPIGATGAIAEHAPRLRRPVFVSA